MLTQYYKRVFFIAAKNKKKSIVASSDEEDDGKLGSNESLDIPKPVSKGGKNKKGLCTFIPHRGSTG